MLSRVSLFAASLAAALVVASGLSLAGVAPSPAATTAPVVVPAAATAPVEAPQPVTQVDTVYLTPQESPQVVVTKVVKTVPSSNGGDGETESGND
jgi:hypothetical protein